VRAAPLRSAALSLANAISIGLRSANRPADSAPSHDRLTPPLPHLRPYGCAGSQPTSTSDVVMDNLRTHKVEGVAEALKRRCEGALSAAYSPDLNPIEMASPSLKAPAQGCRAHRTPSGSSSVNSSKICTRECANYFQHAGLRVLTRIRWEML